MGTGGGCGRDRCHRPRRHYRGDGDDDDDDDDDGDKSIVYTNSKKLTNVATRRRSLLSFSKRKTS